MGLGKDLLLDDLGNAFLVRGVITVLEYLMGLGLGLVVMVLDFLDI